MKKMEKMKQRLWSKGNENKGFSLVELIIVMAIMAILTGVVGTQVVPYLNRAREAKDLQIISAYGTAAVSAYSFNAEDFPSAGTVTVVIGDAPSTVTESSGEPATAWENEINTLTGYSGIDAVQDAMSSSLKNDLTGIVITYNAGDGKITVQAYAGNTARLDPVESFIGAAPASTGP